jgi:2-polyprenyl-3-methyl-5-hydroxy-6-metoxy-1,4-benzoquinol methylase
MRSGVRPPPRDETPCNLCGAADYVVVGTRDRDGRPLRTVLCRGCGLVWINPRPSIADMNAYYQTAYRTDYKGQSAPPLRKIVRGFLGAVDRRRLLRELLLSCTNRAPAIDHSEKRTMVDVGCGAGELVYLMRRDGVDASGLEPGVEYAEFARRVLGAPIQTAAVDAAVVPSLSQDLVTMFHALEHVPDPRAVLTTIRGWLRVGGHLVIEVPNIAARVQAPAHRFHYAHLYHFTGATLAALGEAAGLTVVEARHSDDGGNVICIFRREDDVERPAAGLEKEAARTLAAITSHTSVRHYLTTVPYTRTADRLRRHLSENRLLHQLDTIDAVMAWAATL